MDADRLGELVASFPNCRLAVLGDFFLDKYLDVDPHLAETSLETGKTANQVVSIRCSPGAAGTVTSNLCAMGVNVIALGVIGAVALANRHRNDNEYRSEPPPNHDYGYAPEQVVRCESRGDDDQYCPARIGRGRVEIQRQLSRSACRFNSSWGYDRNGIWVNQGCRADFAVLR